MGLERNRDRFRVFIGLKVAWRVGTTPPQPMDMMLSVNFITSKVHDSVPGALVSRVLGRCRVWLLQLLLLG